MTSSYIFTVKFNKIAIKLQATYKNIQIRFYFKFNKIKYRWNSMLQIEKLQHVFCLRATKAFGKLDQRHKECNPSLAVDIVPS